MKKWLRRILSAIGMGLAWAAVWSGAGMTVALGLLLMAGTRPDMPIPLVFCVFGFVGGVTFSAGARVNRCVNVFRRRPSAGV